MTMPMPSIGTPSAKNQQQSPLLRLPGELRNRIYKEVLSEGQVACRPVSPKYQHFLRTGSWPQEVESSDVEHQHNTKDRSDIKKVRFQLYRLSDNGADARELHQMKYVCRQLYLKTSLLDFEFNDLVFVENGYCREDSMSSICARFVGSCSSIQKAQLRRIEVWETSRPLRDDPDICILDAEAVTQLAKFCTQYPQAKVTLYLDCFHENVDLDYATRQTCGFRYALRHMSVSSDLMSQWNPPSRVKNGTSVPANLKVFPSKPLSGKLRRKLRGLVSPAQYQMFESWDQDGF